MRFYRGYAIRRSEIEPEVELVWSLRWRRVLEMGLEMGWRWGFGDDISMARGHSNLYAHAKIELCTCRRRCYTAYASFKRPYEACIAVWGEDSVRKGGSAWEFQIELGRPSSI